MKWIKKAKELPPPSMIDIDPKGILLPVGATDGSVWSAIAPAPPPPPKPEDIPFDLALDALGAHGVMIKNINQSTNYSADSFIEFDLSMTILVDPSSGLQTLNQLNSWFFSKAYKKW